MSWSSFTSPTSAASGGGQGTTQPPPQPAGPPLYQNEAPTLLWQPKWLSITKGGGWGEDVGAPRNYEGGEGRWWGLWWYQHDPPRDGVGGTLWGGL